MRRVGLRPTAHREGDGDAWLEGGSEGGGEAGGVRGAEGEATGDDQNLAALVWHGHASGGHATGHADIGMVMFLSS